MVIDSRPAARQFDLWPHPRRAPQHPGHAVRQGSARLPAKGTLLTSPRRLRMHAHCHSLAFKAEKRYTNIKVPRRRHARMEYRRATRWPYRWLIRKLGEDKAAFALTNCVRSGRTGMMPGAVNIPDTDFDTSRWPRDKATPLIFCTAAAWNAC